jgi:hypothetical protein
MSRRYCWGAIAAFSLALASGCCCHTPWPCGDTYCGTYCGCKYWHEWFSHKPRCCDPCDECGNFVGSLNPYVESGPPYTPYGPLYSNGSPTNRPRGDAAMYPTPADPVPAEPTPATPTPAEPPSGVFEETQPPSGAEEMPGPSTSLPRGGQYRSASRYGPVDSPRGSRTLGKPRARLFFR